ncbi:hypothetical protein J2W35_004196 [Variovorax boronicumulans]|uniref:hypothetical protein n=1 Tax=Variovorax boronicumulans TaxID=436515 RepID=UPI00277EEB97|nr:hypothetical protein [Variovorax boronicumulans]MDQ0083830.1 hypothetical protein [Variovorax boronicumulans]
MKYLLVTLTVLLGAVSAYAQPDTGISMTTDPARAAAVLNHAQQLQMRPADNATIAQSPSMKAHKRARHHHQGKRSAKRS